MMTSLTRRTFLTASAALAATPTWSAPLPSGELDVVIVGAGAAGIAAARKLAAANRRFVIVEASDRIGGRCLTDNTIFGVPYDCGAHWLHMPDINPVAKLAAQAGLDVYPAPPGQKLRIGRRNGREGELENFLVALVRAYRAIDEAARGKVDPSGAQALPKDLGDWRPTVEFVLGPFGCGKDLREVSALDFVRSAERDVGAFCRQGLGTLVLRLAEGLPVELSTPVTRIESRSGGRRAVVTPRGTIVAAAVIVTVSTNLLASGRIRFDPEPRRQFEAAAKLTLGSYDHIAIELDGNPFGLQHDDLVYEKTDGARTAALLANVSGTNLCLIEVAGGFGRDLSAQGEVAMTEFAREWLAGLYGGEITKSIRRTHATRWNDAPLALGAFSAAPPGAQSLRRVLMEPVRDRLFFAGEAAHETLWGTVGGAWESGERAAEGALDLLRPAVRQPASRPRRGRRE